MRHRLSVSSWCLLSLALVLPAKAGVPPYSLWSTYLAGSSQETALAVAVACDGNVLVGGRTSSFDFLSGAGLEPIELQGANDAIVVKLSPDGSEILAVFSIGGSGDDGVWDLKAAEDGHVYILGDVSPGAVLPERACPDGVAVRGLHDIFVAHLDAELQVIAFQLIGGTGDDLATDLDVTPDGIASLLGSTTSRDLETTAGAFQQTFQGGDTDYLVARVDLKPDRACEERLVYVSYLGSSATEDTVGTHTNAGLVSDANGLVTIAGVTWGPQLYPRTHVLPGVNLGAGDVTVTQLLCDPALDPAEQIRYSIVLGGTAEEKPKWVGVTSEGNIQVVGWTWSSNFPVTEATPHHGQNDIFITEIDPTAPAGEQLIISGLIGGSSYDPPTDCIARPNGSILIGGIIGGGTDFPVTPGALAGFTGADQAFLVEWRRDLDATPAGRLRYASALSSGAWCDWLLCDRVWDLALAPDGTVVACGVVSGPLATDTSNGVQPQRAGGADMFVVALDLRIPDARYSPSVAGGSAPLEVCFDASGSDTPEGTAIVNYIWDFGDGESTETQEATVCHVYSEPGRYSPALTVMNDLGLGATAQDSSSIAVSCTPGDVAPWVSADIGNVQLQGASAWVHPDDRPCLSICAAGSSLGGAADAFHFVHRAVAGGERYCLTATVVDLDAEEQTAGAGVMFRESTDEGARLAAVVVRSLPGRVYLYYREEEGRLRAKTGPTVDELPVTVRIERLDEEVVGYARIGGEGEEWVEVGRVAMAPFAGPDGMLAGIAATAGLTAQTSFRAMRATVCDVSLTPGICPSTSGPLFRRGDTNADGTINISDPVFMLLALFADGPAPSCLETADINDNGTVDLGDAVYGLNYLFASGEAPPPPLSACGADPTPDSIGCDRYDPCP
ncbi:MAG: PKD domain-containing protein [Planctomycetes bacterium]|nr:PKD domain-containing protein [Planctomycetota bacterium]